MTSDVLFSVFFTHVAKKNVLFFFKLFLTKFLFLITSFKKTLTQCGKSSDQSSCAMFSVALKLFLCFVWLDM